MSNILTHATNLLQINYLSYYRDCYILANVFTAIKAPDHVTSRES